MENLNHSHAFEDEELHCLVEAKRLFKKGQDKKDCGPCLKAWSLVDQAILAKYTKLAQKQKQKGKGNSTGNGLPMED